MNGHDYWHRRYKELEGRIEWLERQMTRQIAKNKHKSRRMNRLWGMFPVYQSKVDRMLSAMRRDASFGSITHSQICKHCNDREVVYEPHTRLTRNTAVCEQCMVGMLLGTVRPLRTEKEKLYVHQFGICDLCGQLMESWPELDIDHIRPRSEGGHSCLANKRVTHRACNSARKSKWDGIIGCPPPEGGCSGHVMSKVLGQLAKQKAKSE